MNEMEQFMFEMEQSMNDMEQFMNNSHCSKGLQENE